LAYNLAKQFFDAKFDASGRLKLNENDRHGGKHRGQEKEK